jgi:hypothetical protein
MTIRESLRERRCTAQAGHVSIMQLRDGSVSGFDWPHVLTVIAYKLDLGWTDQVRVCFHCRDSSVHEISEDDDGFLEVLHSATELLPGFPPTADWKPAINAEPFARNETELWPQPRR